MIEVKKKQPISAFISLFAVYLFFTPLDFLPIIPGVSFSIAKILILLPLLGAALELRNFLGPDKKSIPVFLYLLVVGITLVYSIDRRKSLERFISVGLNTILIVFVALRRYRKEEVQYLLKAYVYSAWLLLLLTVIYSDISATERRLTVAVNGQEQDPNYLTGFFTFSICYYLWGFIQHRKKRYLIYVIIFFIPIFLTGSRGGLLANGIAVFCVLFFERKKLNFSHVLIIIITSISLFAVAWRFVPESIKVRYTLEFTQADGGAHRFDTWESCLDTFKRASILRKLLGFGANSIGYLNNRGGVAHNLFIEFLLEYGIIGTILICWMLVYYICLAYKTREGYMIAAFIGYLIMMMSLSLFSYKPMWNLLLFIILSFNVALKSDKDKSKQSFPAIKKSDHLNK